MMKPVRAAKQNSVSGRNGSDPGGLPGSLHVGYGVARLARLIARNATEFAAHIVALDEAPDYMRMLGTEARKLVEASYSDTRIVQDLVAFYERINKA